MGTRSSSQSSHPHSRLDSIVQQVIPRHSQLPRHIAIDQCGGPSRTAKGEGPLRQSPSFPFRRACLLEARPHPPQLPRPGPGRELVSPPHPLDLRPLRADRRLGGPPVLAHGGPEPAQLADQLVRLRPPLLPQGRPGARPTVRPGRAAQPVRRLAQVPGQRVDPRAGLPAGGRTARAQRGERPPGGGGEGCVGCFFCRIPGGGSALAGAGGGVALLRLR